MAREHHHCVGQLRHSRRTLLNRAACGFGSVAAAHLLATACSAQTPDNRQQSDADSHLSARAVSVIFLYMDGGVSQVDSFDPKPELERRNGQPFPAKIEPTQFNNIGNTLASPWKFKNYGQSGIPVSDLFPEIARHV
ncbi:MAG: DUF1501 domain-containing protein, partial [Planctomycetaceae bacterium]